MQETLLSDDLRPIRDLDMAPKNHPTIALVQSIRVHGHASVVIRMLKVGGNVA